MAMVPGASLSFASTIVEGVHHSPAQHDALRLAISALRKNNQNETQSRECGKQQAETLSQSTERPPSYVCFPTKCVLLRLNTFRDAKLSLPLPVTKYTLQRVWDERDLSPPAIFAHIAHVNITDSVVMLQDSPSLAHTSQPSVQWFLSDHHVPFVNTFRNGCTLLLIKPVVQPTGDSFHISSTESTICVLATAGGQECQFETGEGATILDPPPPKRARLDSDLSLCSSPVSAASLSTLQQPSLQPPLIVHARLSANASHSRDTPSDHVNNLIFTCASTTFRIPSFRVRADQYREGDEVIFTGVQWQATGQPWIVEHVYNISTMVSILYAPFMTHVINGAEVQRRICSHGPCSTSHVYVRILNVHVMSDSREVRLTVRDAKRIYGTDATQEWQIAVSHHGINDLFRVEGPDLFWNGDFMNIVQRCNSRLLNESWKMTLTCNGARWSLAQLCACVTTTPPQETQYL